MNNESPRNLAAGRELRVVEESAPVVSVVIPTYNMSKYVGSAIRSVLNQSFQSLEIHVVDDGSTDDTAEAIAEFSSESRLKCLFQNHSGLSTARNEGIAKSSGRYIAFLDADDVWMQRKLERQLALLEGDPEIGVVYCAFRFINSEGVILPRRWKAPPKHGSLYEDLMFGNVIAGSGSAVLVRRGLLSRAGLFDESLPTCEDQDMWRRLSRICKFHYLDEVLVQIRVHSSSIQADIDRMADGRVKYLRKLISETPDEFRHHLPQVSHLTFVELALGYFRRRRYLKGMAFIFRVIALGPDHFFALPQDIAAYLRARRANRQVQRGK